MKLNELNDNDIVNVRCGRAGRESVEWGKWNNETLYVQKHNEKPVVITLRSWPWAEAGTSDLKGINYDDPQGGIIVVEDYYLQIRGLTE